MYKTKVEVNKEVLSNVSKNFERTENFIKQQTEKICKRKEIFFERVFY